ncbi:unnamed protein product [Lymnaea stagnalis]|uniref:Uncharacterized protein n=1 Tax=Lymnaea stagnalis TaxID=6523 RepID=A0AAV2IFP7_LYMST
MFMKNTETIEVKLSEEPLCVDKAKKPPVTSLKATFSATPLYKANESMSHIQGHAVPHINNSIPLSSFSLFAGDSELGTSFSHPQSDTSQASNNLTFSHHQQPGRGYDLTLTNKAKATPGVSFQNKMKNDTQMFSLNSRQKNDEKLGQNQKVINEVSWKVTQKKKTLTKQLRKGCSETCRRKCNQVVSQAIREELFSEFWQLENDTCRREYILTIVNKVPKKSNRTTESRRGCTIEWSVPLNGALVIVCKKFFLDTFDISENFVKTVHDKIERNADSMADMRGKHGKRSVVFAKEEKEMEKFIKSLAIYKAVRCVRCNTDFPRWCLESSLSLNQLYKEYANDRKQQGVKPACKTSFKNLCAKKFNLKYNSGVENICELCSLASTAVNE